MAIRLQELHSAAVHLPIALLPIAVGTDLVGRATGSRQLMETGRLAIGLAAAGAISSAVTGLIAQEEVIAEGEARDTLITHRNLNLAATAVATMMATWRARHEVPSLGYLAVGLAGMGVVSYTAYLGGTLVYKHGVGVAPAGGQYRESAPELGAAGQTRSFIAAASADLLNGAKHLAEELAQGRVAPSLGLGPRESAEPVPVVRPQPRESGRTVAVGGHM